MVRRRKRGLVRRTDDFLGPLLPCQPPARSPPPRAPAAISSPAAAPPPPALGLPGAARRYAPYFIPRLTAAKATATTLPAMPPPAVPRRPPVAFRPSQRGPTSASGSFLARAPPDKMPISLTALHPSFVERAPSRPRAFGAKPSVEDPLRPREHALLFGARTTMNGASAAMSSATGRKAPFAAGRMPPQTAALTGVTLKSTSFASSRVFRPLAPAPASSAARTAFGVQPTYVPTAAPSRPRPLKSLPASSTLSGPKTAVNSAPAPIPPTAIPERFAAAGDPSPTWLTEALYGPSYEDWQALRTATRTPAKAAVPASLAPVKRKATRAVEVDEELEMKLVELERRVFRKRQKR